MSDSPPNAGESQRRAPSLTCSFAACPNRSQNDLSLRVCSGCHLTRYCSQQCQRNDWRDHRSLCRACDANDPLELSLSQWMITYNEYIFDLSRAAFGYDELSGLPTPIADARWNALLRDFAFQFHLQIRTPSLRREPYKDVTYVRSGLVRLDTLPSMLQPDHVLRDNVRSHHEKWGHHPMVVCALVLDEAGDKSHHLETFIMAVPPYSLSTWPKTNEGLEGDSPHGVVAHERRLKAAMERQASEP
ncbi:hypothetical protein HGRIS_013300 [Hohenbuehelia grisea]|uniref:MYND-type domain-containing protein n=1 Tax=Hohenbuehelia grisea TaxID=104357 RepID=A0ABR3IV17_9AGAR